MTTHEATPALSESQLTRTLLASLVPATIIGATIATVLGQGELLPSILLGYLLVVGSWLAIVDAHTHRLPNLLIYPSYAVLAALLVLSGLTVGDWAAVGSAAACATITGVVYLGLSLFGSMGMGDVKLGVLLGGALGWVSWSAALTGALLGFAIAAFVAILLIARGRGKKTHIAFGPYLIAGALIVLIVERALTILTVDNWPS